MKLAGLIQGKRGKEKIQFSLLATATVATVATHKEGCRLTVASAAGVAVANRINSISETNKQTADEKLIEQLRLFELERVDEYTEDREAIVRVNNMAWEFMQVDGMTFKEAITLAAEVVVNTQVSACEAAYEDVQELWKRLTKV